MKKKVFAFLTAIACMAGCIPVSVFAADPWDEGALYRVQQVDDIGGLVLEQLDGVLYVLSNWYGQIDAIWAEQEMAEVGDILQLSAPEEIAESEPGILLYTEETPLELVNLGSVEEIGERMPLTITEENGYAYKLTDAQGAQYAYRDNTFLLEGSQAGDIVNFWVYGEYGVMPVAASSDFEHDYYLMVDTDSMLAYRLQEPDLKYQLDFGTLGCGVDLDAILEGQKPLEDGDVLYISRIESVAEVYPCCIHIAEDAIVRNMGSMEEIAEKKTLVITKDGGLSFTLQDAEDAIYRYDDSLNQYLENGGMDEFTAGDSVDFWVYEDRAVAPIGAAETPIFEPKMFVVVDRYEYTNGDWDFIIMGNRGDTYTLSEEQIAEYLVKGEKYPEYGDILGLQGQMTATEEGGTNWMSMNFLSPETNDWDAPGVMKNYGSVIENGETAVFEVVWKDKYHSMVELKDADGEKHYINMNYQEGDLLYDIQVGSEIEMYTYQGKPKFPAEQEVLPVNQYAVVGIRDDDYAIMDLREDTVHFLSAEDAAEITAKGQDVPEYGDILKITGYPSVSKSGGIGFFLDYAKTKDGGKMQKLASVTADNITEKYRYWQESDESFCTLTYLGENSRRTYTYELGYTGEYLQPGGIDWTAVERGTYVDMLTYEGKPIVPIYIEVKESFTKEYVVVGVDDIESPKNYVLMEIDRYYPYTYYLTAEILEQYYKSTEAPAFGDILRFTGKFEADGKSRTQHFTSIEDYTVMEKIGSVYTANITEMCTISPSTLGNSLKIWKENSEEIRSFMDFTEAYHMPGAISWQNVRIGDKAEMLTYKGVPCIPISLDPLGDYNSDGSLDILDVIGVNRRILGAEKTPARAVDTLGQADFNGNGKIDADDSLGMLKRIVGLET